MSSVRYIYSTSGDYVAFVMGPNVFTPEAEWIGFIVNGNEVYKPEGEFLGYLLDDDRLVRRRGEFKLRRPPHPRPARPFRPFRPFRRFRMARLPHPYDDVFETADNEARVSGLPPSPNLAHLEGASLIAGNGAFLGNITRNRFDPNSISNSYGPYGSKYSPTSIFNQYGQYGGSYSQYSPFNQYSVTPPKIMRGHQVLGFLSVNQYLQNRIDPETLSEWLTAA